MRDADTKPASSDMKSSQVTLCNFVALHFNDTAVNRTWILNPQRPGHDQRSIDTSILCQ